MPITKIEREYYLNLSQPWLLVTVSSQTLCLINASQRINSYTISTSKYGLGNQQDSYKTPLGAHRIKQKIGHSAALGEIFVGRVAQDKQASIIHQAISDNQDLILSRIMWLEGLESGINRGTGIDSYARYIYIHGTQEEGLLGQAASHGCVRMRNTEVIELFDLVDEGTFVYIEA